MPHTTHQPARSTGRTLALITQMQQVLADGDVPFIRTLDIERFRRAFEEATGQPIQCELVDTTQAGVWKDFTRVVRMGPDGEPVQGWLDAAATVPELKPELGRTYRIALTEQP